MTREEIKNTPELVDFMLDKCVLADSRTKVRKRLEEVCNLAIKALEQGSVLDKIRAEIEQEYNRLSATRADETLELGECLGLKMALKIISKYKAEKE